MELVKKRESVVHVFEGKLFGGNPRAFINIASRARRIGLDVVFACVVDDASSGFR